MPYPEHLLTSMREELTRLDVEELRDAQAVDNAMDVAQEGTSLFIVNSVCGCAAANARPAVTLAKQYNIQPDRYFSVFAGQDLDATTQFRAYLAGIPPSSPSMFLIKDGDPVFAVERRHIEGRSAQMIAQDLVRAFDHFCQADAVASSGDGSIETPEVALPQVDNGLPSTFRSIL